MNAIDLRMLELLQILKATGKIRFKKQFCDGVGMLKQNLIRIEKGERHFTQDHIKRAVENFNVNANWIFGVSKELYRN